MEKTEHSFALVSKLNRFKLFTIGTSRHFSNCHAIRRGSMIAG